MRVDIPRFAIFLVSITALFWFIPNFYAKALKSDIFQLGGSFSPITKEFVIWEASPEKLTYKNEESIELDRISAQKMLPFLFHNSISKWGAFPLESVDGESISYDEAKFGIQMLKLSARDVLSEALPLYVLFESSPMGAFLEMPSDMLLIKSDRVVFIDCASGKENIEKSQKFTEALKSGGADFPILKAFANPSDHKPFDEGLLFIDGGNRLFQLKMIEGAPFVKQLSKTMGEKVLHISVDESDRRLFYSSVVTEESIYINTYEDGLKKLPLTDYNPKTTSISAFFTPMYHSMTYSDLSLKNPPTRFTAITKEFDIMREYQKSTPQNIVQKREYVSYVLSFLTPFRLVQFNAFSSEVLFDIKFAPDAVFALFGIAFALMLYVALNFRRLRAVNLIAVCFGGIPGFITLQIFGSISKKG
ncbi:MAG: DUF4857 domain-containing protein [Campylobacteraceae bacterium]|jgi:hypothetical protein|nr:DUF4857 domain-containing protein [Campylobacteraceae bacterium]